MCLFPNEKNPSPTSKHNRSPKVKSIDNKSSPRDEEGLKGPTQHWAEQVDITNRQPQPVPQMFPTRQSFQQLKKNTSTKSNSKMPPQRDQKLKRENQRGGKNDPRTERDNLAHLRTEDDEEEWPPTPRPTTPVDHPLLYEYCRALRQDGASIKLSSAAIRAASQAQIPYTPTGHSPTTSTAAANHVNPNRRHPDFQDPEYLNEALLSLINYGVDVEFSPDIPDHSPSIYGSEADHLQRDREEQFNGPRNDHQNYGESSGRPRARDDQPRGYHFPKGQRGHNHTGSKSSPMSFGHSRNPS
jgi:hypothetical protein